MTEQSPQAQRREREMERRNTRKTAPPLASPFSTQVVGVTHAEGYPDVHLAVGEVHAASRPTWLTLKREPHNEYDPNAIGVWWDAHKLGHLNRVIAFRMAPELDAGTEWLCRVEEVAGEGDLIGVSVRCKRQE